MEPNPVPVARVRWIPVLGSDGGEELAPGYALLRERGIQAHAFGSKGWYVVVLEADLAKSLEILAGHEESRPFLMSKEQVDRYLQHYGYGDGAAPAK